MTEQVDTEGYRFEPSQLAVTGRRPGISAFMRIRDGAFSLEAAIRSHIGHFDEIVAVHNRCTDQTPDILERLAQEYGPRLRVFHYLPPVFPPGSDGHRREPANAPRSLVNYYNFALTRTRFSHVTKLDDDHVAMAEGLSRLVADVRAGRRAQRELACFSGLNLARDEGGQLGILQHEPFAGSGDHWVLPVGPDTYFVHDRRFEVLRHRGLPRRFHGFTYWHLKHLKPEFGFSNYDLASNPHSRYAKRLEALRAAHAVIDLPELARTALARLPLAARLARLGLPVPDRDRLIAERAQDLATRFSDTSLAQLAAGDRHLRPFLGQPG